MKNIASTLFLLLLFVPLIAAAARQDETAELASKPAEQASITLPELIYDSRNIFPALIPQTLMACSNA